ncbi:hypothetical protein EMIT0P176_270035 [Pseudomonas sp. IT-P176]
MTASPALRTKKYSQRCRQRSSPPADRLKYSRWKKSGHLSINVHNPLDSKAALASTGALLRIGHVGRTYISVGQIPLQGLPFRSLVVLIWK